MYTHGSVGKYISLCTRRYCKFVFRFITKKKIKIQEPHVLRKHLVVGIPHPTYCVSTNIVFRFAYVLLLSEFCLVDRYHSPNNNMMIVL